MNLLSDLLAFTARQIAALRAKNVSQDSVVSGINTRVGTAESNITSLTTRFDTTVSANSNSAVTLYNNPNGFLDGTITLSKSIDNFDFIDIFFADGGTGNLRGGHSERIPAVAGTYTLKTWDATPASSDFSAAIDYAEQTVTISGTTFTAARNTAIEFSIASQSTSVVNYGSYIYNIVKIVGIKMGNASPAELTDIRVGADNVTYASAGAAVRGQISDIKDSVNALGFEEIQTTGDLITAQGLALTATASAMWGTNGTIVEDSSYQYYQAVNQPIKVEAGKTYKIYGTYDQYTNGAAMLFDKNMRNGLRKWALTSEDGGEYTIPSGYSYLCLDLYSGKDLSQVRIIGDVGIGKYSSDNIVIPDDSITPLMTDFTELVDDDSWVDTTNMIEDVTWSDSGYMRLINGQLTTSQYTTGYIASDFVAVVPEFKYRAVAEYGNTLYAVFFSDSKNDGTSVNLGWLNSGDFVEFTVPSGKTYVSFNCVYNGSNKLKDLFRRTQLENEKGISIPRLVIGGDSDKPFYGKKIVNFGDSIFGQARPPVDVSTFLAEYTGATVYNAGFGGCQMSKHAQTKYDPFSMYRLAYSIANNDWTLQDDALANNNDLPTYYAETIAMLKGLDFSEIDYITIGYGINDFHNGTSLEAGSTNGYKYCMDYSIRTLLTAFPNLKVFIVTMTYGFDANGDTNSFTHTSWVDSTTHSYLDFIQGQYDVSKNYQLPVIDLYYDLGINSVNKLQYFSASDGTHQAVNGRMLLAKKIAHDLW